MRLELIGVNTTKLHEELIAAGIQPQMVESLENTTWITVEDAQVDALNAVVASHNPTPIPAPPSLEQRIQAAEAALLTMMGL